MSYKKHKRLPATYIEALGYNGRPINIQRAQSIITRVGIYAEDISGHTPLSIASGSTCPEIITWLLTNGADVNYISINNVHRSSALHQACYWKSLANIKILIEAGANLEAKDSNEHTPFVLVFANTWTDPIPFAEYLIEQGAKVTDQVKSNGTQWNEDRFNELLRKYNLS